MKSRLMLMTALALFAPSMLAAPESGLREYAARMEARYDLPRGLLIAILDHENRGPTWRNVRGRAGEIGVAQVKPEVLATVGLREMAHPFYREGMAHEDIRDVQRVLRAAGHCDCIADGVYGPVTAAAVLRVQQALGLPVDGILGPRTWRAVMATQADLLLWNPYTNIEVAARYLAWLRRHYTADEALLVVAYNGGPRAIGYAVGVLQRWKTGV